MMRAVNGNGLAGRKGMPSLLQFRRSKPIVIEGTDRRDDLGIKQPPFLMAGRALFRKKQKPMYGVFSVIDAT